MAKLFSISVPDEMHAELQQNKDISVSAVCQKALREALAGADDLAEYGAERLRKELKTSWEAFKEKCYKAGQEWVAKDASLRELECAFEGNPEDWVAYHPDKDRVELEKLIENGNTGAMWLLDNGIFDEMTFGFIPEFVREKDADNEMFWSFVDGAEYMWGKIKVLHEREE